MSRQRLKLAWFAWGYWPLLFVKTLSFGRRLELIARFLKIDWSIEHAHRPSEISAVCAALAERRAAPGEIMLEAGCYLGGSSAKFSIICAALGYRLCIYDSFEGVEAMSAEDKAGTYDFSGHYAASEEVVRGNLSQYGELGICSLHKGWFADTLANARSPHPVRVAYIDCDLAKGTKEALAGIVPSLTSDGWIFSQDFHIDPVVELLSDKSTWLAIGRNSPTICRLGERIASIRFLSRDQVDRSQSAGPDLKDQVKSAKKVISQEKIHITYVGNFLSEHGLNPTYSEALVPKLREQGMAVRPASSFLNPLLRFLDMGTAVWNAPRQRACVILDLCSGPRAFPAAYLVSRFCRLTHKPYIVVLHGGNLPGLLTKSRSRLLSMLRGAERVVSPSKYLADVFADHLNTEVIPNALSIDDYSFRARTSPQPNFFYLRAFHRNYGPIIAIKAFAIVQQQYPNAHLTMVGPEIDDVLRECESLAAELKLQSNIDFLGRVSKSRIPELGSKCDIFLNPTFVDNTPVSTVEAMAMGMCIVATTAGGLPYLLQDGHTALLVSPGDEVEMATAILRILRNPTLGESLSRNARSMAEQMDWRTVTPRWVDVIQSVAKQAS
jgi:glycosyltransferase involved in cell wall biosynthesis